MSEGYTEIDGKIYISMPDLKFVLHDASKDAEVRKIKYSQGGVGVPATSIETNLKPILKELKKK